jgi:peptidoglycan/xylan/chitin deacetylase (PgdA/CDA1 family)
MRHYLINIFFILFNFFNSQKEFNFRILMFHNMKRKNFKLLEKNLKILQKKYNFIDPNTLKTGIYPNGKNNLLLTFDDGFKSNFVFAKSVLNKLKIKAIFFIITDLINSNNYTKKKIIKNIFPDQEIINFSYYQPMRWHELKNLEKMGHVIGTHTKSHLRLSDIKLTSILKKQIIFPIQEFKKNQIKKPIFFAYPFGDFHSFNKKCFNIAKTKYKYIFSGLRGDNLKLSKIIFRDNIGDNYSLKIIFFFIRGYSDFLYKRYRKVLLSF